MRELTPAELLALEVLAAQTGRSARFAPYPHKPSVLSTAETWESLLAAELICSDLSEGVRFYLTDAGWAELGQRGLLVQAVSA